MNVHDTRPGFQFTPCQDSKLIARWRVTGTAYATELQIEPTKESRDRAEGSLLTPEALIASSKRSYVGYQQLWGEIHRCAILPRSLTPSMSDSLYEQMACHAHYAARLGGNTWDFEAWRQDVDWSVALNPGNLCQGHAWPDYDPFRSPMSNFIASLDGRLVYSTADPDHVPPRAWLIVGRETREISRTGSDDDAYTCLIHSGKSLPQVFPSGFMAEYIASDRGDLGTVEACAGNQESAGAVNPVSPSDPLPTPSATGPTPPAPGATPAPVPTEATETSATSTPTASLPDTTTPAPSPPPEPTSEAPVPQPVAHSFAVYGTCADGACGLHRRAGPGYTAYAAIGVLADGDVVNVACQTRGEFVAPNHGVGSDVWDRLTDGSYVTDVYLETPASGGSFTPGVPGC